MTSRSACARGTASPSRRRTFLCTASRSCAVSWRRPVTCDSFTPRQRSCRTGPRASSASSTSRGWTASRACTARGSRFACATSSRRRPSRASVPRGCARRRASAASARTTRWTASWWCSTRTARPPHMRHSRASPPPAWAPSRARRATAASAGARATPLWTSLTSSTTLGTTGRLRT